MSDRSMGAESDELPVSPIAEVDPGMVYSLGALMAPIFDAQGKVSFSLLMAGFHTSMTGAQVMATGERLRAACARISAFVAGREIGVRG
jgi:DNA-binding IclR family transcriptional regulator